MSLTVLWGSLVVVIVYVDPLLLKDFFIPNSYSPFFVLLEIVIWYTLALIFKSPLKSLLVSSTIVLGIGLTVARLMHAGLIIVLLLTLCIESWYIYRSHEKIKQSNESKDREPGV